MTDTIAIDFGTSRTKLAYSKNGGAELMRFEWDRPFVPSLFYLPAGDGTIRWGNDAEEMLARDPAGVVVTLKRQLGERNVRGAGGRKETPGRLLALMLADLRRWAGERVPAFGGQPPSRVCLTLPSLYRPVEERALRDAAAEAGFAADAVELVPEPVAAARAWLADTGNVADEVVVFDAGGGTIDWAYLRRENGAFRIVPECPADGDRQVGGHDVDELLFELLEEAAGGAGDELASRRSYFLREVRRQKEEYCRDLPLHPVRVGGREITLPAKAIANAIEERFISRACDALGRYLDKVRTVAGSKGLPPVLLVGGSSALKGLAPALERRLECKTAQWERSEFATVLGALFESVCSDAGTAPKAEQSVQIRNQETSATRSEVTESESSERMNKIRDLFGKIMVKLAGTPQCHILRLGPMYIVAQAGANGIGEDTAGRIVEWSKSRYSKVYGCLTPRDWVFIYRSNEMKDIDIDFNMYSLDISFGYSSNRYSGTSPGLWLLDRAFRKDIKGEYYTIEALFIEGMRHLRDNILRVK